MQLVNHLFMFMSLLPSTDVALFGFADSFLHHGFPALLGATTAEYWYSWGTTLWSITQVALGLGFVIFVHELGHFLAAKYFGVKCEKFYVGFDVPIKLGPVRLPAKLFHFQWGETEYGIGSIPLGGYVKMLGQDDDPRNAEKEAARIRLDKSPDGTANQNGDSSDSVPVGPIQYDPRSFPAKSVWARMIIISAGVIMNVIFGVIFAAIAFRVGVPYEPTIVGEVLPGDPAWIAGLQNGDKIVKIAEMTKPDPKLAFRDLREMVALAGFDHPEKPIPLEVNRDGKAVEMNVVGTMRHDPEGKLLSTGFRMAGTTELSPEPIRDSLKIFGDTSANQLPDLKPDDVIVGVNGKMLPVLSEFTAPLEIELNAVIHPLLNDTVTLNVKRPLPRDQNSDPTAPAKYETVDIESKPLPYRTLGVGFKSGPVVAIQSDSIAAKGGVKIGDQPIALNGEPINDVLKLPLAIAKNKGKSVKLTLQRPTPEEQGPSRRAKQNRKQSIWNGLSLTDSSSLKRE